jgi:hypothetical protein
MRKFAVPVAALFAAALTSAAALAATTPAAPAKPAAATVSKDKLADCTKQWKAQKKHSQTRKAFMAACQKA